MISDLSLSEHEHAILAASPVRIREQEPMAPYTTFRIGGPADLFAIAERLDHLRQLVRLAISHNIPWLILGRGANILVSDAGFRGLVILNRCRSYRLEPLGDTALLDVESGASLPHLSRRMAAAGWGGLEWAVGVPGTLGGAIAGNAGAHGQEIEGVLRHVTVLTPTGEERQLGRNDAAFTYRSSRFRGGSEVVLAAQLELTRQDPAILLESIAQYRKHRTAGQPGGANVGSVFKNPAGASAWQLVDGANMRGYAIGDAQISLKHANFIVNRGQARAEDVRALIELARERVLERFGVVLEPEIIMIGF